MHKTIALKTKFQYQRESKGQKKPQSPVVEKEITPGRIPRISRLMALAIHLDQQINSGKLSSQSEISELGHVSRPRVTQIMNFNLLAPDIQEEILFLPKLERSQRSISERDLRPIMNQPDWQEQRRMWRKLRERNKGRAFCSFK